MAMRSRNYGNQKYDRWVRLGSCESENETPKSQMLGRVRFRDEWVCKLMTPYPLATVFNLSETVGIPRKQGPPKSRSAKPILEVRFVQDS